MTSSILDLLVVGAGPVGLATAASALQRGASTVLVVEQARELRPAGSNLDLLPNAYRILCNLVPGIQERLHPFIRNPKPGKPRASAVTADGRTLSVTETRDYGTTASLYWWQLQKALLDSLPNQNILVLNHQLVNVFQDEYEGVAVAEFVVDRQKENIFKNWDGDDTDQPGLAENLATQSYSEYFEHAKQVLPGDLSSYGSDVRRITCRARIIVGADGINSVTRRCIYRDTCEGWEQFAEALYSGFVKVVATGDPGCEYVEEQSVQELYMKDAEVAMLTCNEDLVAHDSLRVMIAHPRHSSRLPFRWYIGYSVAIDEITFKTATKNELRRIVLNKIRAAGFSEVLANLSSSIWESSPGEFIPNRAYYIVPATHPPPYDVVSTGSKLSFPDGFFRPWHHGRVVLVGDSAHACPPFLAQGTAMGFEDVCELMKGLAENHVWASTSEDISSEALGVIFEKYRNARLDRVSFVQKRVMNRVSEYDLEKSVETRRKLWTYDPEPASDFG